MAAVAGDVVPFLSGSGVATARSTFDPLATILAAQAPIPGLPQPSSLDTVTDPILPVPSMAQMLAHFWPDLYDLREQSHLSRLMGVLLGDTGTSQLRKIYLTARMQSVIATLRYEDLDALYGVIFGVKRLSGEVLNLDAFIDTATPAEWAILDAKDADYRSRLEAFSRALPMCTTPEGIGACAAALLSEEVDVYEMWELLDQGLSNPGGAPPAIGARSYGDVEDKFVNYGAMNHGTYADVEGGSGAFGRTPIGSRNEFVIRPKGQITAEQTYHLVKALGRLKPCESLMTIDPAGIAIHTPVKLRDVGADSSYWEISAAVAPTQENAQWYQKLNSDGSPTVQPKPAGAGYQGEAWSYNTDIAYITSHQDSDTGALVQSPNFDRIIRNGKPVEYTPDRAMADPYALIAGRAASSGVLATSSYLREDPAL